MPEETLWGIHAGKTGDADSLFLSRGVVAIGWHEMDDLSKLPPDREAFRKAVRKAYPSNKDAAIANNTGQLLRFAHEMKPGDIVVYPSKRDRQIHLGRIEGDYLYDPQTESGYPHQRRTKWLKSIPRTRFSQGALYEIGSAMSLFQVKNYADEFIAALGGKTAPPPVTEDETVAAVSEDMEQTARDFIIKRISGELKGHSFTELVAHLLNSIGYRTRVSPEGPDGGIDIIAHRDELGFEPPIIKVQVKSSESTVGDPQVSALYGKIGSDEFGLFVTLGSYTTQAKNFARSKTNLRLIDGDELVQLILSNYDKFGPKYKAVIPLKRVYIPEVTPG